MNVKGTAQTEYASLSGKIHTLVIDKSLTISGACADAKAVRDAIDKAITEDVVTKAVEASLNEVSALAEETARTAAVDAVASEVNKAVGALAMLNADDINAICK